MLDGQSPGAMLVRPKRPARLPQGYQTCSYCYRGWIMHAALPFVAALLLCTARQSAATRASFAALKALGCGRRALSCGLSLTGCSQQTTRRAAGVCRQAWRTVAALTAALAAGATAGVVTVAGATAAGATAVAAVAGAVDVARRMRRSGCRSRSWAGSYSRWGFLLPAAVLRLLACRRACIVRQESCLVYAVHGKCVIPCTWNSSTEFCATGHQLRLLDC